LNPADFLTDHGFRRPDVVGRSGLRSGLSLHLLPEVPGLRCRPSSLYTFPADFSPAWLGIATDEKVYPTLAVLHRRVPKRALKFFSSPLRLPFRHAVAVARRGPLLAHCVLENAVIHEFILECTPDGPLAGLKAFSITMATTSMTCRLPARTEVTPTPFENC
jgi:hypothetical protein